jgi:thioredoxin-related protein
VAKPVVDRLERTLEGEGDVIRLDVMSSLGLAVARMYGVRATPTLLVFDGAGNIIHRQVGIPNADAVLAAVGALAGS